MSYVDHQQTQKANLNYIRGAMDEPMLEREHELDLARRWRDHQDEKALHELISAYRRLAIAVAGKYKNYGLPMSDLIQEGNIGLMQAANRFEPERELRFSTYASWWIRSAIQDYILRNWSIVRTGTTAAQKSLFFNLRRLKAKIESELDGETLDEQGRDRIANELKVRRKDVDDMENRLSGGDASLNIQIGERGEDDWQSFLADERSSPEDIVVGMKNAEARSQWLNSALGKLTDRERQIIEKRHLQDDRLVTLEDLGKELGVSKERVRQLEKRAMDKLKVNISKHIKNVDDVMSSDYLP